MIAALALLASAYAWTANGQASIQHGVAETDDRDFRIDCAAGGKLALIGPAIINTDADGAATSVQFSDGRKRWQRSGVISMGDTAQFSLPVAADDRAITTLLHGQPLTLSHGAARWTISGKGAAAVLKPLMAHCRTGG